MKRKGFTLVELSIVLVIIGLLIGGILIGQNLINSAKINAQISQLQQFDIATNNFKEKYKGLPGDNTKLPHSNCSGGNNNGYIDSEALCSSAQPLMTYWGGNGEPSNFFYQLTSLGILKSTRDGGQPYLRDASSPFDVYANIHFPMSKLDKNNGIIAYGQPNWGKNFYIFVATGKARDQMNYINTDVMSTAADAFALDGKMDDGLPLSGKVRSINNIGSATGPEFNNTNFSGYSNCNNSTNYLITSTAKCQIAVELFSSN